MLCLASAILVVHFNISNAFVSGACECDALALEAVKLRTANQKLTIQLADATKRELQLQQEKVRAASLPPSPLPIACVQVNKEAVEEEATQAAEKAKQAVEEEVKQAEKAHTQKDKEQIKVSVPAACLADTDENFGFGKRSSASIPTSCSFKFDLKAAIGPIALEGPDGCKYYTSQFTQPSLSCGSLQAARRAPSLDLSIALVSSIDPEVISNRDGNGNIGMRCPQCTVSLAKYAYRYGYSLAWRVAAGLKSRYFVKMFALKEMLFDFGFDAVMWVDNDGFISNSSLLVEDFLASSVLRPYPTDNCCADRQDTNSLVIQSTDHYLNSGVIIMRRTKWASKLLDDVLRVSANFTKHPADQDALHNALNNVLGVERDRCVKEKLHTNQCWMVPKRPFRHESDRHVHTRSEAYAGQIQSQFLHKSYLERVGMGSMAADLVAHQMLGAWGGYKIAEAASNQREGCVYNPVLGVPMWPDPASITPGLLQCAEQYELSPFMGADCNVSTLVIHIGGSSVGADGLREKAALFHLTSRLEAAAVC
jgi:hypothetical protein